MARLLAALIFVALAISPSSSQGSLPLSITTPAPELEAAAQEYLDAHNRARAEVGVRPLQWTAIAEKVAAYIVRNQRDQKGCKFANYLNGGKYGVNQHWVRGAQVWPEKAVLAWVAKKRKYNYANNSCVDDKCGVYTQVVWRKSIELGCAQASCANSALTVCCYYPPGNIVGEKPY